MDWRLIFSGLQEPAWAASAVVAAVLAAAVCLWLMRLERGLVSRRVGWTLLGLRLSVIGLLLMTLLQPGVSLQWSESENPRLVVAADVSGSMRMTDAHSTPAEFLRWCQALGLLGNAQTIEQIDAWIADSQDGREPDWGMTPNGPLATDVGEARQRHMEQLFADVGSTPRTQLVRRLLAGEPNRVMERLNSGFDPEFRTVAAEQHVVSDRQLLSLLEHDDDVRGEATDLAGLLDDVLKSSSSSECAGVILFTDGRQTSSGDAILAAQRLGSAGISVYPVPIGSQTLPRDVIVQPVDAPGSVFPDERVQITSRIAAAGFDGQTIGVRLRRGEEIFDEVTLPVSDGMALAEFELPQLDAGYHDLTLDADVLDGEQSEDNNQQQFTIAVVDNQAAVMLIDQVARWEFRYLNNLLGRDNRIDLATFLIDQPFLELLDQPALNRNVPPAAELRTKLTSTDLLILGDVRRNALSDDAWAEIAASVAEDGLTLAVIPGRRNTLDLLRLRAMRELMPVARPERFLAEDSVSTTAAHELSGFQVVPTAAAGTIPMFQLQSSGRNARSVFRALPGHPWILSGSPLPAASVWATADIQADDGLRSAPLIVHHYFGSGQVIWMGMDSTWRWRRRAGDAWHHRFWGQFVRWAVRSKSSARSGGLQMTLSSDVINEQQSTDVAVRWTRAANDEREITALRVVARRADGVDDRENVTAEEHASFVLNQVSGFTDRYAGQISGLPRGRYRIELDIDELPVEAEESVEAGLTVVTRASAEFSDTSCDREQLRQLAEVSGGKLVEPWELRLLPEMLQAEASGAQRTPQEWALWDHWGVLVAFFFLLMTQWVIRKQSGLP